MTVMALRLEKISHRRAGMMLIFTAGEEITAWTLMPRLQKPGVEFRK